MALPGEFTKRAFLNGRIDLTQAEAVIDLINAKTMASLEIANRQLRGDFFNLLNLHTLRGFDTDVSSPGFGYWNGGVTGPRTIQVGGRLLF